jgi:hypothetical protein
VRQVAEATHGATPGRVDLVAVDADPTGNQQNGPLGPVDECREVAVGETFDIDVIVDEVYVNDGLAGWEFRLSYDAALVRVVGIDIAGQMLRRYHIRPTGLCVMV